MKIKTLGDLDEETFEKFKAIIKSDVRRKRAKHAVYENQRTIRAVEALKNNDVKLFGELMNASHVSLRDDYEVTGIELDTLVEEAWKVDGVIGSRMTGAGFGGCTVSIVKDEAIDTFIDQVGKAYKEKIGYAADFYVVEIGDGPRPCKKLRFDENRGAMPEKSGIAEWRKMDIQVLIRKLVSYGVQTGLVPEEDVIYDQPFVGAV